MACELARRGHSIVVMGQQKLAFTKRSLEAEPNVVITVCSDLSDVSPTNYELIKKETQTTEISVY